ncbi:hypothetical protein [Arsukibacterium sp.]|uniref:hypothetical protein n=1 Tax=Arsukibacterium sp. TaxID=1977258 RepID=UPI00299CFC87|nr:hypothetical protein [Arsukibacterium sp.]MDX1538014.1 hypothetical protein [Arsukibacterium sp.]
MMIILFFTVSMVLESATVSDMNAPTEVLVIKSPKAEVLEKAYASFKDNGFDIAGYDVILLENEQVWIVVYQPSDYPVGQRGSVDKKGFTVEVDKTNNNVIKSYYSR